MPTFTNPTVGVAASELLASNGNRKSYTIINRGTANIFIGSSSRITATAAGGFQVEPGQAFSGEDDPSGAIWAISTLAGQQVNIATIP